MGEENREEAGRMPDAAYIEDRALDPASDTRGLAQRRSEARHGESVDVEGGGVG